MSELNKILLTSVFTIVGGITIFTVGQIFLKLLIDPINDLQKCIGEICDSLIYYSNVYSNPGIVNLDLIRNASKKFRQQATLIIAKAHIIKLYRFFVFIKLIPSRGNIKNAHKKLIGLANGVYDKNSVGDNKRRKNEIIKALNLKIIEEEENQKKQE